MDFRKYIKETILKKNSRILEFGPLIRPIAEKKDFKNLFFADIKSTADIKKLYKSNEYLKSTGLTIDTDLIVDIDYVINESYEKTFKNVEKFDVVVLSHVVEHMPDILFFFSDIKNILKRDGSLVLIYPDARYCFDHFRNGTSFIDALECHLDKKINKKAAFDFTYNVVNENNAYRFWKSKNLSEIIPNNSYKNAINVYKKAEKNEIPDDVHFWPFSDYQFIKFLYDMDRANMLDFYVDTFYETQVDTQEFMVVLKLKNKSDKKNEDYKRYLDSTNPVTKHANLEKDKQSLLVTIEENKKNNQLERDKLINELNRVYSSRRWKFFEKVEKFVNLFRS